MILGCSTSKTSRFSVLCVQSCSPEEALLERLCSDSTYDHARLSSRMERQEDEALRRDGCLTYGEVPMESMREIIEIIRDDMGSSSSLGGESSQQQQQRLFVDLGSGSGRSTLSALLLDSSFTEGVGIEIMRGLYNLSLSIQEKCDLEPDIAPLSFHHASIFDTEVFDWPAHAMKNFLNRPNVIFINSTCFTDDFMSKIAKMCSSLYGSYVVTLTTPIYPLNSNLDIVKEVRLKTSWGSADVFVQKVVEIY